MKNNGLYTPGSQIYILERIRANEKQMKDEQMRRKKHRRLEKLKSIDVDKETERILRIIDGKE